MEKQVTNLLLLLLCPVLVAHVPDQDLHTVLRDVRAALAEHKVKIELLQTLNQEQAAKLEELTPLKDLLRGEYYVKHF
ncbi:unnamed protein product [Knipowitschia caucasica]